MLQALRKSLLEIQRVEHEAPPAPVVYPTEEEWRDFYGFIEKVKPLGVAHGILKIIPPASMRNTPDGTVAFQDQPSLACNRPCAMLLMVQQD